MRLLLPILLAGIAHAEIAPAPPLPLVPSSQQRKGRAMEITGGIMTGVGIVLCTVGVVGFALSARQDDPDRVAQGVALGIGGTVFGIVSVVVGAPLWYVGHEKRTSP